MKCTSHSCNSNGYEASSESVLVTRLIDEWLQSTNVEQTHNSQAQQHCLLYSTGSQQVEFGVGDRETGERETGERASESKRERERESARERESERERAREREQASKQASKHAHALCQFWGCMLHNYRPSLPRAEGGWPGASGLGVVLT